MSVHRLLDGMRDSAGLQPDEEMSGTTAVSYHIRATSRAFVIERAKLRLSHSIRLVNGP